MLKYCLRENLLTAKPDDYMAQVTDSQVFTLDDIINRMIKRGTTVSGTKTVRCASVVENKPARIIVLLDASVPAGDFTLEVRTKLSSDGSKKSKTLKKGYYRKTLKAVV